MHHWEHFDSRLLVCEIYALPNSNMAKKEEQKDRQYKQSQPSMASRTNFSFAQQFNSINTNQQLKPNLEQETENLSKSAECLVVSVFFNQEKGLLVYDSYARGEIYSKLISVRIPYHFFVTKVKILDNLKMKRQTIIYLFN